MHRWFQHLMHKRQVCSCMCSNHLIVFQKFVNFTRDNCMLILFRNAETNIHLWINSSIHPLTVITLLGSYFQEIYSITGSAWQIQLSFHFSGSNRLILQFKILIIAACSLPVWVVYWSLGASVTGVVIYNQAQLLGIVMIMTTGNCHSVVSLP